MYLPVRVSILIFSPVLMNSGACTVMPVSIDDGFLHVVGGIAAHPFGRVGHGQNHIRRQFDGNRLVLDEGDGDGRIFHEVIFVVADQFRRRA